MKRISTLKLLLVFELALLVTLPSLAQVSRISGTVTGSKEGQPLPGVSVLVKGTNTGTTTDAEGAFAVSAG